jgi:hemin uptake protein HemP
MIMIRIYVMLQLMQSKPSETLSTTSQIISGAIHNGRAKPVNGAMQALPSEALLRGHKTVPILHMGSLYKLQATKLGKLILTK